MGKTASNIRKWFFRMSFFVPIYRQVKPKGLYGSLREDNCYPLESEEDVRLFV
ncbi:MAG: hypothetical protein JXN61_10465 [Sedimentisphaerales bacterium]|nr:hypothetical protein [Sedimentisphaerales bacterium]